MAAVESSSSSVFPPGNSRPPEDTVFYSIFPDSSVDPAAGGAASEELQSLHLRILRHIAPITAAYIWQHQPFSISVTLSPLRGLAGHLRFGDNLEDEWFVVYLLFEISKAFPNVTVRVWDTDGEFLLIEAAFHLPKWLNPETSVNRVFIRHGLLHIIPKSRFPSTPSVEDSLRFLGVTDESESRAADAVQLHLSRRICEYPQRAYRNVHQARATLPLSVAWVLKHEPLFVSLAVEGFYDRDIDSMKYAAKMERFLPRGKEEEMVEVVVRMSRAMYAQLVQQKFQAPSCFPMPERTSMVKYMEAELGLKISCGLEMIYQHKKKQGVEGKGSSWAAFLESLERSGYFEGLLPGSKEYRRRMENVDEYYRNSSLHSRESEALNAPVRRIDEVLALPYSVNDFSSTELPPSDDDSWLYGGGDELDSALEERQKEMELYDMKKNKNQSRVQADHVDVSTSSKDSEKYNLGGIAESMQAFVAKVSSYEGAEVPENRSLKAVDFKVDEFMRAMDAAFGLHQGSNEDDSDADLEDGLPSDLDYDDSGDESLRSEDMEDADAGFMSSYTDALNRELKATTLHNTFARHEQRPLTTNNEGINRNDDTEELNPLDVDFNLVKNLLDSYSSQEGMSGPASNLLGLMGIKLPDNAPTSKSDPSSSRAQP